MSAPTKSTIISDLHRILFCTALESAPDSFDVLTGMARAFLRYHGLHFKYAQEIPGSEYWSTQDVEAHFYDTVAPGIVPSVTAFEYQCTMAIDFDLWELMREAQDVFDQAHRAIKSITQQLPAAPPTYLLTNPKSAA